ncbi:MAG: ATP synthase subunit I [Candidatus Omnitrophota bacterium]|nr:MAG: ATP synthase subunit I [Candidatus Omnitrophota bacterium]
MKGLRNKIIKKALLYAGIGFVLSFFIKRTFSWGLLLGTVVSIINFLLLERQIKAIVGEKKFLFFSFFGYIIRYLLMALALFLSIRIDLYMFFGAALGLFMVRLGIYGEGIEKT